jgi:hypothetical protein
MNCMNAAVANPVTRSKIGSAPSRKSSDGGGKRGHVHPWLCWKAGGLALDCLICKDLERVFECRRSEYDEARSAAYYQVTTEFAAHKNVDKERAKSDLEDHQLVCVSAAKMRQSVLLGSLD